jgi:hypothetical protein
MLRKERLFNLADVGDVKSTVDDVTDIINSTIMEDAQDCEKNVQLAQNMYIGQYCPIVPDNVYIGSKSSVTQNIVATLLQSCYQNAEKMRTLTNDIKEKIKSYAEKKGISGIELVKVGNTESKVDIQTYLTNEFSAVTKQPCDATIGISQNVGICAKNIHLLGTIEQSAQVSVSGYCTQISKTIEDVANTITKEIDSKAASGENWSDILGSLLPIIIIGAIVTIIGIIVAVMMRGGEKKRRPPPGYQRFYDEPYDGRGEITGGKAKKKVRKSSKKMTKGSAAESITLNYDW